MIWRSFSRPEKFSIYRKQFVQEVDSIGLSSIGIVALMSVFMGAVIALQTASNMDSPLLPAYTVGFTARQSILLEFSPTIIALILAGKVGSNIASEIGTMRVTEQIDAMKTMAVNPIQYLIVPRVFATTALMPVLTLLFDFVAIVGSYIVGVGLLGIDFGPFDQRVRDLLQVKDIVNGLIKAGVFGVLIAFIGCYKGFYAGGGAKGVGEATTSAVVTSSITILIVDYFLTVLMWTN